MERRQKEMKVFELIKKLKKCTSLKDVIFEDEEMEKYYVDNVADDDNEVRLLGEKKEK